MSNLASVSCQVGLEPIPIRQLMDMLSMPNVRKMVIKMKYESLQGSEPPIAGLDAFFRGRERKGRTYPKLEEFDIVVQDTEGIMQVSK